VPPCEGERERELRLGEEKNERKKKKGVAAAELVFKEGRQPHWRPTVIQGRQRRWRPTVHMARHPGSRWIPRVPLSPTPFSAPKAP
jgi:hypothetical protein